MREHHLVLTYRSRCDAQVAGDGVCHVAAGSGRRLTVDVEEHGQVVVGKLAHVLDIVLGLWNGDTIRLSQVLIVRGRLAKGLVLLDQVLQRLGHDRAQLRLRVQDLAESFSNAVVESRREIQREIAETGSKIPDLIDQGFVHLDLNRQTSGIGSLGSLAETVSQRNQLLDKVAQGGVGSVGFEQRQQEGTPDIRG